MFAKPWIKTLLYVVAAACAVLLFAGNGQTGLRSVNRGWNLGHIPAFGLWIFLLAGHWKRLSECSFRRRTFLLFGITFAVGLAIETIQAGVGRTFSWDDLGNDMLGCALACFFLLPTRQQARSGQLLGLRLLLAVLIAVQVWPFLTAVYDEITARRQFPVLGSFESPFELDRWRATAIVSIDRTVKRSGRASLQVDFNTQKYSTVGLHYFPRDWRGYRFFKLDVYNPGDQPLTLFCRVNDTRHGKSGFRHDDRFNKRLIIGPGPGWHAIDIAMQTIRNAPAQREMDLAHIDNVMFFTVALEKPRRIYFDNLRLVP